MGKARTGEVLSTKSERGKSVFNFSCCLQKVAEVPEGDL